jgi:hypothetical protein
MGMSFVIVCRGGTACAVRGPLRGQAQRQHHAQESLSTTSLLCRLVFYQNPPVR